MTKTEFQRRCLGLSILFGVTSLGTALGALVLALTDTNKDALDPSLSNPLFDATLGQLSISLVCGGLFAVSRFCGNREPSGHLDAHLLEGEQLRIKEFDYEPQDIRYILTLHETTKESNIFYLQARRADQELHEAIGDHHSTTNHIDFAHVGSGHSDYPIRTFEQFNMDDIVERFGQADEESSECLLNTLLQQVDASQSSSINPMLGSKTED